MRKGVFLALLGPALAWSGAAQAEVLSVEGVYAAREPGAVEIEEITIERFGGDVGEELAIALTDALTSVALDGQPYFTIKAGGRGGRYAGDWNGEGAAPAAATLRGTALAEVYDARDGETRRKRCVERDERKKCVNEKVEIFPCWQMRVRLQPSLRLIAREGGTLYAIDDEAERIQRYCENENVAPSASDKMRAMVEEFAQRVRYDLAPEFRREDVRIMEDRKGLSKPDSAAFKNAVRQTKTDQDAACSQFETLLATNPDHPSLVFNAGLCAERADRLDEALDLYRRAESASSAQAYARAGLDRVTSRMDAAIQLERRYAAGEPVPDAG